MGLGSALFWLFVARIHCWTSWTSAGILEVSLFGGQAYLVLISLDNSSDNFLRSSTVPMHPRNFSPSSKVLTLSDEIILPGRSQIRTPLHSQKITMGKTMLKVLTRDDGAPTSKPLLVGYHIGFGQDACPLAGAVVR